MSEPEILDFILTKDPDDGNLTFYDPGGDYYDSELHFCCGCTGKSIWVYPCEVNSKKYPINRPIIFKCSEECELTDGTMRVRFKLGD